MSDAAGSVLLGTGDVARLEGRACEAYDMPYAVAVSSATTALMGAALALGLKRSRIATTPWSWGGILGPALLLENQVEFCDVDRETLTLDPAAVHAAMTPATRAIVAAHVDGVPCDAKGLRSVADQNGAYLIIDAAQGFGALRDGMPAGNLADVLVLSFGDGKGLAAGGGGMALMRRPEVFERFLFYTQHPCRQRRQVGLALDNEFALNGRIHPAAAAAAAENFDAALAEAEVRRRAGFRMLETLNRSGLVQPLDYPSRAIEPSFERVTAAWKSRRRPGREERLLERLRERGLHATLRRPSVRLLYRQPAFRAQYQDLCVEKPCCPVAEDQVRRRFELVSADGMSSEKSEVA